MKNLSAILFLLLISFPGFSQDEKWYVWVDTQITQNGEQVRLVSDKPILITCCVKSPKFKRFQKKAAKWIKTNYDDNYSEENPLKNIEDESFAEKIIGEAVLKSKSGEAVLIVTYSASCK